MVPKTEILSRFPAELIERVELQAAEDAEFAAALLRELGLTNSDGVSRPLPADLLLVLGAAMRLKAWEEIGLDLGSEGLPSSTEVIQGAFEEAMARLQSQELRLLPTIPPICLSVMHVTVRMLAWTGPRDIRAEVLLHDPDEDEFVAALADYLWRNRVEQGPDTKRDIHE